MTGDGYLDTSSHTRLSKVVIGDSKRKEQWNKRIDCCCFLNKNMEPQDIYYNKAEYVETASGNKVSRQTVLCGSQNIVLHGKVIVQSDAIIRGDLANVRTGRYCIISKNVVIRPPYKKFSKGVAFFPLQMGDHVFVGERAVVNAAVVGSYIYIGKNAVIGRRCILKDCCYIEDGAVVPPETIVPSFTRFAGNPAVCVEDLPECTLDLMLDFTKNYYQHFLPAQK